MMMIPLWILAATALSTSQAVPPSVAIAIHEGRVHAGDRVKIMSYRGSIPGDCQLLSATPTRPVQRSGSIALRLEGERENGSPCAGTGVAKVQVKTKVWVSEKTIARGEALQGNLVTKYMDVGVRRAMREVPGNAVARRQIQAGAVLELQHAIVPGTEPGTPVRVVLSQGPVRVAQKGVIVPCIKERVCARLPSGKRVEGTFSAGVLEVKVP